jgi:hypothetical protein
MSDKSGDNIYSILKLPIAIIVGLIALYIGSRMFSIDFTNVKKISPTEIEFFEKNDSIFQAKESKTDIGSNSGKNEPNNPSQNSEPEKSVNRDKLTAKEQTQVKKTTELSKTSYWKGDESGYYFYIGGERHEESQTAYDGDDLVLFYKPQNKLYRFKNYKNLKDGKLREAETDSKFGFNEALWKGDESGYYFYIGGERHEESQTAYDGDDVVLFYKPQNKLYRFKNYRNLKDGKLREAETDSKFGFNEALWKGDESGYYFYIGGERQKESETAYDGDDLVLFYKPQNKLYRFKNYRNLKDGKLREAETDSKFGFNEALWKGDESGYYFYIAGERHEESETAYDGDDLVLFHKPTNSIYVFSGYKKKKDGVLRKALIK